MHNELRLIVLSGMDSKEKPGPPATISESKCDGDSSTGDSYYLVTILMRIRTGFTLMGVKLNKMPCLML